MTSTIFGQIKIIPELGISHSSLTLYSASRVIKNEEVNFLVGLNGIVPISDRLNFSTRLGFVYRENYKWTDLCICPDYLYTSYKHDEFNIDMSLNYSFFEDFNLGVGPSFIRKINANIIRKTINDETTRQVGKNYFAINGSLSYKIKFFTLKLIYLRKLKEEDLIIFRTEGKNRFDFSIAIDVFRKK